MTTSEATVYNWALAALGSKARIQLPTESSPEAEVCKLWFESVRDQVLQTAPWDSAKAYKRLALSVERETEEGEWMQTDPAPGWRFAYSVPNDMLSPRFLSTYAQFELGVNASNQKVIYTNEAQAVLCYTKRQTNIDMWEPALQHAIGFALAAHIAMKLTGSQDKVRLVTAQAIDKIMTARQAAANAPQFIQDSTPEWIAGRGYAGASSSPRYIHPYAEFTVTGVAVGLN